MDYTKEIWKDIQGFNGVYKISNKGRVKSFNRGNNGLIMKTRMGRRGDEVVGIKDSKGKLYIKLIHRLVAQHFIPNPKHKRLVRRIDGNKMNNEVSNLKWEDNWDDLEYYYKGDTEDSDFGFTKAMDNSYRVRVKVEHEVIHICNYETKEEAVSKYKEARVIYERQGIEALKEFARKCYKERYTSKYKNVSYDSKGNKWMVQVVQNKEKLIADRFDTEREAVEAIIDCRKNAKMPLHYTHIEYLKEINK